MARPPSMEVFESYFQRADLDRDGRISGAEAVAFFQGSNLPKPVLAQIWMYADQNKTGFLGRQEFYNALRLVTVAQSGQELAPNIVKAALFGPPAAKIPAPQINPVGGSAPQLNSMALPAPHMGAAGSYASQHPSYGGPQAPPNMGMNQQFYPSPNTQFMRPPQTPAVTSSLPLQGSGMGIPSTQLPTSNVPNISTDWLAARLGGASVGPTSQISNRGTTPSMTPGGFGLAQLGPTSSVPARPQEPSRLTPGVSSKLQDPVKDSKELVVSGNGFSSDSGFGGDVFSAYSSRPKQAASTPTFSLNTVPNSSVTVPTMSGPEPAAKQSQPDPFAGMVNLPTSTKLQRAPSGVNPNQFGAAQNSGITSSTVSVGAAGSASGQSQLPWQKMTQSDINKYTKVFVEVDTDRDGKITGGEARNLFLSWRLPREVLKQVWDLSDQDNDSMLSLREFCTALYFMERYREGRPLPEVLPDSVKFDVLLPPGGQPVAAYGGAAWGPASGFPHQGIAPGRPPVAPSSASRPPAQVPVTQAGAGGQPLLQKSRVPVLEKNVMNQLGRVDQNALTSKFEEASEAEKKVEGLEKEILDSREKIEFYRTMMQELVLYKSRCDNRLNEITERALADKREVDSLGKKYEEKYKQVGDLASKLSVEEATFRDIQERKMELHNAIVKVEQGGSADGLLQVRADRIQSDLEELVKALNERCKKFELHVKPTALVELPFGWQPGIQEGSADWDEDWDKFEDEGFIIVKELTVDVPNIAAPPKPKSNLVWNNLASMDEPFTSSPTVDGKLEKPLSPGERVPESGSAYGQSEEGSTRSLPGSPLGRSTLESPSQEYPATHFDKSSAADTSPRGNETHSDDHGAAESTISGDKYTDEHSWGPTFDANDDTDSVWGFGSKESHFDSNRENAFFDSGDLGLNPIRTSSSSHADSMSHKKSTFFADSVPGTPLFNSSSSPMFGQGSEDHYFDNFSRFDSFRTHDSGFFAPQETMTRFDSIRSTRDSGAFTSFDDSDPFGPTGTFKYLESQTPRRDSDALGATSSFKYSESQTPRRDSDTFSATDSFKYSESRTPRRDSDNWSAF